MYKVWTHEQSRYVYTLTHKQEQLSQFTSSLAYHRQSTRQPKVGEIDPPPAPFSEIVLTFPYKRFHRSVRHYAGRPLLVLWQKRSQKCSPLSFLSNSARTNMVTWAQVETHTSGGARLALCSSLALSTLLLRLSYTYAHSRLIGWLLKNT